MSPAKLILITTLLVNYSSASDIINPFADPSLILNSQTDYTQEQEIVNSQEKEEQFVSPTIDYSTNDSDVIDPFSNPSVVLNSQENYSPPVETTIVNEAPMKEYSPAPIVNDIEVISDKPTYQKATNQGILDARKLPPSNTDNQSYSAIAPDIQGKYRFIEGTDLNVNKMIKNGYLVIEKLDEKNFGYYYTFSLEKATPKIFFGIFNYDKGKFNQRVIKNEGSVKTENLTNTNIVTDENELALEVNIEGGSQNTLWEYDDGGGAVPFELKKSLKEAKHDYEEIYKKNFSKLTY